MKLTKGITREDLMRNRILFIRNQCPHCMLWIEFIERINKNLPVPLRIKVIDCIDYDNYGVITNPLIRIYKEEIKSYPTLILGSQKIEGSNTRIELEAWIKSRLINDFIFPYPMSVATDNGEIDLRFEKNCEIKKSWFGKKINCK